jgi:hypothetical protein
MAVRTIRAAYRARGGPIAASAIRSNAKLCRDVLQTPPVD